MSDSSSRQPAGAPVARHGRLRPSNPVLTLLSIVGIALAVLVVSGAAVAGITVAQLSGNVKTVTLVGQTDGPPPNIGAYEGGFNVLVVGSDVCEDGSGCHGRGAAELNDVTMLLHVSEDQTNAVAVSIPRDTIVPIPGCPRKDGKAGLTPAMAAWPINNTLSDGGLPCTVLTVKQLTGLDIQFALEVKFSGVINITDAIGGVPICVDGPINDRYSGFNVPAAGTYTLSGAQALDFLRTRHGVGDGSDLGRISGQQMFLSSMITTMKTSGTLSDPIKMLDIAQAVSQNTVVSSNLKNPLTLVAMAGVLKNIDLSKVVFVQYPTVYGTGAQEGKVVPVPATAAALFAKIKADQPFLPSNTGLGTKATDPSAPPVPTPTGSAPASTGAPDATTEVIPGVQGQQATESTCAKPYSSHG